MARTKNIWLVFNIAFILRPIFPFEGFLEISKTVASFKTEEIEGSLTVEQFFGGVMDFCFG